MQTKLLFGFIISIIALIFTLLFFFQFNNESKDKIDVIIDDLFDRSDCNNLIKIDINSCSNSRDKLTCNDQDKCSWCSGNIDGAKVSSCETTKCGCPLGFDFEK